MIIDLVRRIVVGKRKRVKYQCLHVGLHGAESLWKLMLDSFLKNYTRD